SPGAAHAEGDMRGQTRRTLLGAAASAFADPPALAQSNRRRNGVYERAIVIDALGSPGGSDPSNTDPNAPLSARDIADIRASGSTAVNLTIGAVGNDPASFEQTMDSLSWCEREIDAHPDVFLRIRSGADLQRAKTTGRLGIIYGLQDSYP